jgi:hypothetical protein
MSVKIEGVIRDGEIKNFAGHFLDLLDSRITELKHTFAICADKVIVLLEFKGFFELGYIFSELMLGNQVAIQEQFDGVVKCCPADPVFLVLHVNVQALDIKVAGAAVDFIENGEAFGRFPVFFLFQIIGEKGFYLFFDFGLGHVKDA